MNAHHSFSPRGLRRAIRVVAALSGVLVFAGRAHAEDDLRRTFDIATGPAEVTLSQFAAQAGVQFIFSAEKVRGERTQAVRGRFSPWDALSHMLAGTQLQAVRDRETRAITVDRAPAPKPSAARPAQPGVGPSARSPTVERSDAAAGQDFFKAWAWKTWRFRSYA